MAILTTPPDPDTYKHVLIRSDRSADPNRANPIRVTCYHENTTSRSISWDGHQVHAVFLQTKEAAHRAWRLGWRNITDEWNEYLDKLTPKPTTPSQQAILDALTEEWQTKAAIISASGIADTEWRTAIRYLLDKGLAVSNATRKTTNRGHRYRLPSEN